VRHTEKPTAQIAHLVFATQKSNPIKPKVLFFSQRNCGRLPVAQ